MKKNLFKIFIKEKLYLHGQTGQILSGDDGIFPIGEFRGLLIVIGFGLLAPAFGVVVGVGVGVGLLIESGTGTFGGSGGFSCSISFSGYYSPIYLSNRRILAEEQCLF